MRLALTVSRATILPPMAAWMGTSKSWRGMSSRRLLGHPAAVDVGLAPMHDGGERVDRNVVDEQVDPDEVGRGVVGRLVVEAGVALGAALELVEEVDDHLGQGDPVDELESLGREVLHARHLGSTALAEVHDRAGVLGGRDDGGGQDRLGDDGRCRLTSGSSIGLSTSHDPSVGELDLVRDGRGGGDERQVEFPFEPLPDDLHVQQTRGTRNGSRTRALGTTRARR